MKFCGVKVYLMARLTYLLIYFYNKPVSNGCCHRQLPGLSMGKLVWGSFVDSAGGFWSKLDWNFSATFF